METSSKSLRRTYKWVQSRIRELTKTVKVNDNQLDFRCVEDVIYLEYIGEGSDYD